MNISAIHYYEKDTGMLIHSNVSIYEWQIISPSVWMNNTFIRNLVDFSDLSEEPEGEFNIFQAIGEFILNNALELTILCLIILGTILAINRIHHQNVIRSYEEYKEFKRQEKGLSKDIPEKKINKS